MHDALHKQSVTAGWGSEMLMTVPRNLAPFMEAEGMLVDNRMTINDMPVTVVALTDGDSVIQMFPAKGSYFRALRRRFYPTLRQRAAV
jgi:hypothetical protein